MAEDVSYLHAIMTGGSMAVTGTFAFFAKRFIGKVDETAAELAKHKLEDVSKYATGEQLVLVHQRIDESRKSVEDGFKELRTSLDGIRNILINNAAGHR